MEIQGLNLHAVQTASWFTLISNPKNKGHLRLRALLNQSSSDVSAYVRVSILTVCSRNHMEEALSFLWIKIKQEHISGHMAVSC